MVTAEKIRDSVEYYEVRQGVKRLLSAADALGADFEWGNKCRNGAFADALEWRIERLPDEEPQDRWTAYAEIYFDAALLTDAMCKYMFDKHTKHLTGTKALTDKQSQGIRYAKSKLDDIMRALKALMWSPMMQE